MIIIFEGADETGKTNIAEKLAKLHGFSYFKNHQEHKNFTSDSFKNTAFIEAGYLIDLLKQINIPNGIILDRHMPSEWVYSKVYDRETNDSAIWEVDKQLANLNAVMIYCYKQHYEKFDDEIIKFDDIENIKSKYQEYLKHTKIPTLQLETTDENLDREVAEIENFLKDEGIL